jgi:hypothetical protein
VWFVLLNVVEYTDVDSLKKNVRNDFLILKEKKIVFFQKLIILKCIVVLPKKLALEAGVLSLDHCDIKKRRFLNSKVIFLANVDLKTSYYY